MSEGAPSGPAVKICGVTTAADARLAIDCGASFVGLNFYPKSPRALEVEQARRIREAVADEARVVGVFVNSPPDEVAAVAEGVCLDLLQFHGDEPLEEIRPFASRALRVFHPTPGFDPSLVAEYHGFWGVLFDAPRQRLGGDLALEGDGGRYGGTGRSWDYSLVRELACGRRAFVAGGISADNVGAVLEALPGVFGVDVCSGVERSPGKKDEQLVRRLFSEIAATSKSGDRRKRRDGRRDGEHGS